MELNENLRKQLRLAHKIEDCECDDGVCVRCEDCNERGAQLAALVIELHEAIKKDFVLPAVWIKPDKLACERCGTTYFSEPGRTGIRLCNNKKCEAPVDSNPHRQGLTPETVK